MNLTKIVSSGLIAISLTTTLTFAAPEASYENSQSKFTIQQPMDKDRCEFNKNSRHKHKNSDKRIDPLEVLEKRKESVQLKLKEGKISKEEADAKIERIDAFIKKIKEFNSLPLDQKKQKLITDFRGAMDKKISEGKLSKEKADKLIEKFNEKIDKWDGTGYPMFNKWKK